MTKRSNKPRRGMARPDAGKPTDAELAKARRTAATFVRVLVVQGERNPAVLPGTTATLAALEPVVAKHGILATLDGVLSAYMTITMTLNANADGLGMKAIDPVAPLEDATRQMRACMAAERGEGAFPADTVLDVFDGVSPHTAGRA